MVNKIISTLSLLHTYAEYLHLEIKWSFNRKVPSNARDLKA